jgi:hypothetical protein
VPTVVCVLQKDDPSSEKVKLDKRARVYAPTTAQWNGRLVEEMKDGFDETHFNTSEDKLADHSHFSITSEGTTNDQIFNPETNGVHEKVK